MAASELSSAELFANAEEAEAGNDFSLAVLLWEISRLRFPDDYEGYVRGGMALKRLGESDRAIDVLAEGISRFPDNEWLANEHGWLIFEFKDGAQSAACWAGIREAFPDNVDGYLGGAAACRSIGAYDEADAIARAGLERFADNEALHQGYAWNAEARQDFPEAVQRWQQVCQQFPDEVANHVRHGECLHAMGRRDEGDRVLAATTAQFSDNEDAAVAYAAAVRGEGRWPEALRRWEMVISRHPQRVDARRFAAEALMELGRSGEAMGVLAPALRLHPDDPDLWVMQGWLATRSREMKLAEEIWSSVRSRFPDQIDGHHGYAAALRDHGRLEEADVVVTQARLQFPSDSVIAMEYARIAERKESWTLAVHRWHSVVADFPTLAGGYVGLASALINAGLATEAAEVLQKGAVRCPDDFELAAATADAAATTSDWSEALRRWAEIKARFPDDPRADIGSGVTLRKSGQLEASAVVLSAAAERYPAYLGVSLELAVTLSAQRQWPKALALWASLKQRHPNDGSVRARITDMMGQALADQSAHGKLSFVIPEVLLASPSAEQEQNETQAAVLKRFESLGDTCEFGIVQRMYGVEHVSLLRWANTTPENLVKALNTRLAGVGDPEHTVIKIIRDEYTTEDRRYYMHSHTFTSHLAEPLEQFAPEQCRRMQWLRRRLIDSLTSASKIFVYKYEKGLSQAQVLALDSAVKQYSPQNVLLCVKLEEPDHAVGTVERIHDGLYVGYLDKFSTVDVSMAAWLEICGTVAAGVSTSRARAEAG